MPVFFKIAFALVCLTVAFMCLTPSRKVDSAKNLRLNCVGEFLVGRNKGALHTKMLSKPVHLASILFCIEVDTQT